MVAVPPMMRARLLMRRQSAHGRSDTHPHSTRATVLAIPETEKQHYIKYCNHSPYDCSGSRGIFFFNNKDNTNYIKYCNHSPYDCSGSSGFFFYNYNKEKIHRNK